jgi:hypothetical protein
MTTELLDLAEIDLDGHVDTMGIRYFGNAVRQPNGKYVCLAIIDSALCWVEVKITKLPSLSQDVD